MSSMDEDSDQDFLKYVLPAPEAPAPPALRREFKPWHRPRKQIVRDAWAYNASRIMQSLFHSASQKKIFRYFTLPGPDMLDIWNLENACKNHGYKLAYAGMHASREGSADERTLSMAENRMRSTDWIDQSSKVFYGHNLLGFASSTGGRIPVTLQSVCEHGPFHAVNFDLCDHLIGGNELTMLDALAALIRMQTQRCYHDWLLFVATRVDRRVAHPRQLDGFFEAIASNMEKNSDFDKEAKLFFERLKIDFSLIRRSDGLDGLDGLDNRSFSKLFALGFGKWLLAMLMTASPPHRLSMLKSYSYCIGEQEGNEMLSLVYKIKVVQGAATDPTGTVVQGSPASQDDEAKLAKRVLAKSEYLEDLDRILTANEDRLRECVESTIALLRKADYDQTLLEQYEEWARLPLS